MLFNFINVLDRLCSMFGGDFYAAAIETSREKSLRQSIADIVLCVVYTVLHVAVLYGQIVTLNVAVNSNQAELIVILTSSNFSEVKGGVLKRFSIINVFQVAMGDCVERFQTLVVLCVIAGHQISAMDPMDFFEFVQRIIVVFIWMTVLESVIDWIKHGFIDRFNAISPHVYTQYSALLSHDFTENPQHIAKRIGLVPLPLAAIVCIESLRNSLS